MLFTRLELNNVGVFGGLHTIELRPLDSRRPIVLFGGLNGAGKTTILQAVRLCLYGRRAIGPRPSLTSYHAYLTELIHRGSDHGHYRRNASIAIEFEHNHASERVVYRVERVWHNNDGRINDELLVFRDGLPLDDLHRSQWQSFIDSLIPAPLAQLFFFDGERIQALADEGEDTPEFAASIRSLLGLDLIDQLQADLAVYQSRQGNADFSDIQGRLNALVEARERTQANLIAARQSKAEIRSRLAHQQAIVRRQEDRLVREGGEYAERRSELKHRRIGLQNKRTEIEEAIRQLAAGALPFALAPDLVRRVIAQLEYESGYHHEESERHVRAELKSRIFERMSTNDFWEVDGLEISPAALRLALLPQVSAVLDELLQLKPAREHDDRILHALRPADQERIVRIFEYAIETVIPDARRLGDQLSEVEREQRQVERDLQRAPSDEHVRPLIEELAQLNAELQAVETELRAQEQCIDELSSVAEQIERDFGSLQRQLTELGEQERALRLTAQVQSSLRDFRAALGKARVSELERTILECFNQLARKDDLVRGVSIDPDTFQVSLLGRDDRPLSRSVLSAGEKQIYAISLLWALAKISGRRLPIIIDTPLGRLDNAHRSKLVSRYFPFAAEQVLVLSTDSELDSRSVHQLAPSISRWYRIEFDPILASSKFVSGYFQDLLVTPNVVQSDEQITGENHVDTAPWHSGERPMEPASTRT